MGRRASARGIEVSALMAQFAADGPRRGTRTDPRASAEARRDAGDRSAAQRSTEADPGRGTAGRHGDPPLVCHRVQGSQRHRWPRPQDLGRASPARDPREGPRGSLHPRLGCGIDRETTDSLKESHDEESTDGRRGDDARSQEADRSRAAARSGAGGSSNRSRGGQHADPENATAPRQTARRGASAAASGSGSSPRRSVRMPQATPKLFVFQCIEHARWRIRNFQE